MLKARNVGEKKNQGKKKSDQLVPDVFSGWLSEATAFLPNFLSRPITQNRSTHKKGHEQAKEPLAAYVTVRLLPCSDPVQTSMLCGGITTRSPSW
ncbi:hypothetical protein TNCV_165691 [Trichonephila clavipes]|nr:hypothetical protein TNCV_165691 [Trichonephila clavipes]